MGGRPRTNHEKKVRVFVSSLVIPANAGIYTFAMALLMADITINICHSTYYRNKTESSYSTCFFQNTRFNPGFITASFNGRFLNSCLIKARGSQGNRLIVNYRHILGLLSTQCFYGLLFFLKSRNLGQCLDHIAIQTRALQL